MSGSVQDYLSEGKGVLQASATGKALTAAGALLGSPPPADPAHPTPPPSPKQARAAAVKQGADALQLLAQIPSVIAEVKDPVAAVQNLVKGKATEFLDAKLASLTSGMSAALGPLPAATLTSMALGMPHAHVKHPPSGPLPIPPIPLPPLGPVMLGTTLTVLINGKPAARCGDFGLSPTCCGILPPLSALYEIFTGSSKVFIGGNRAARMGDITLHCKPGGGKKPAAALSKLAKFGAVAANVAGKAAAASQIASAFAEADAEEEPAMAAAMGLNAAMMAAQMAADAIALALTKTIGTDLPTLPPLTTGFPGMILVGSPNVLISGVPLPSSMAIIDGFLKCLKGLKARARRGAPPAKGGPPGGPHGPGPEG